jgi:uncharacterized membrane protein (UPF0127 family)
MSQIGIWPIYVLISILVVMGGAFAYYTNENNELIAKQKQEEAKIKLEESIKAGKQNSISENTTATNSDKTLAKQELASDDWRTIYPKTQDLKIAGVLVQASVAKTWAERIKGLSDTPYLPDEVVKLFVFDTVGEHSIWMKDMSYAIDIIWVDAGNKIVDIKKNATPESYPESFSPKTDALYVIETKVGFVEKNKIKIGDEVALPE